MKLFRGYGGVQSYPSRTKDVDDVDFSAGSVGLGVAITSFCRADTGLYRVQEMGRRPANGQDGCADGRCGTG